MGQLVRHDGFELLVVEPVEHAAGDAQGDAAALAPDGERVGRRALADRDPRLGHVGEGAEPVGQGVQPRLLLGGDLVRAGGREGDLVTADHLADEERDDDRHARRPPTAQDEGQHGDGGGIGEYERTHDRDHADRELTVRSEPGVSHVRPPGDERYADSRAMPFLGCCVQCTPGGLRTCRVNQSRWVRRLVVSRISPAPRR